MPQSTVSCEPLEVTCKAIVKAGDGICRWEWDDHLQTALTTVDTADCSTMHSLLEQAFPYHWDVKTVTSVPQPVAELLSMLGGLRNSQELFTGNAEHNALVFAAWWPWNNGQSVSVRIGTTDPSQATLRRCFGL
ncbi:hypothetical protein ACFL6C_09235 [Myxococcota bacterium]